MLDLLIYYALVKLYKVMKYSTKGAAQIPFLSQISIWKTEPLLQRNPHHVLDQFPYFFLPHWTTPHNLLDVPNHMPNQANQISYQAIYKSYTLLVKHPTYQKAESSRAASFLKLDSMVNNNSIFITKCAELSAK